MSAAARKRGAHPHHLYSSHDEVHSASRGGLCAFHRGLSLGARRGEHTAGRQVEPHGFAGIEGKWYLLGWCRLRGGGRSFRLDRIESARVTDETVPSRNVDELLGDMLGDVRSLVLEEG